MEIKDSNGILNLHLKKIFAGEDFCSGAAS